MPTRAQSRKPASILKPGIPRRGWSISTPGETVGVIVTERGIAVNDNLPDLKAELIKRGAPVKDIRQLRDEIYAVTGVPKPVEFEDKVVALIEYRDGSIIDVIRQVKA